MSFGFATYLRPTPNRQKYPHADTGLLFNEFQKDPPDGYEKVSLAQVAQADREVHVRLGELTRGGLGPTVDGLPLDKPLREVIGMASVMWLLMPRAKRSAPSGSGETPLKTPKKKTKRKRKDTKADKDDDDDETTTPPPAPHPEAKKRPKRVAMPRLLIGGVPEDDEGHALCFGFNLGTCQVTGDRCDKGLHRCCKPKCFKPHPFVRHGKS